jgi:AcrR family transcriptional regulator
MYCSPQKAVRARWRNRRRVRTAWCAAQIHATPVASVDRCGKCEHGQVIPTRQRLLDAIREAAVDTPLDGLTPASVARRADAHRVTFYRFWPDVQSAIIEAFAAEVDRLVTVQDDVVAGVTDLAVLAEIYDGTMVSALDEVLVRRSVYRTLFLWPVFHVHVLEVLRQRAQAMVDTLHTAGVRVEGRESGTAAVFVAGASLSVFAAWAADDRQDVSARAEEVVAQMPAWWPRASRALGTSIRTPADKP